MPTTSKRQGGGRQKLRVRVSVAPDPDLMRRRLWRLLASSRLSKPESEAIRWALKRADGFDVMRRELAPLRWRHVRARQALHDGTDSNKQARVYMHRMEGLPDKLPKRRAAYDSKQTIFFYRVLIEPDSFMRLMLGWPECSPEPLHRHAAIQAIADHYRTSSRGVYDQLKRAGVKGLPSTWPKA